MTSTDGETGRPADPVSFTVHPARTRPFLALVVLFGVTGLSVLAGAALGPGLRFLSWVFLVLFLGQLSTFFFPTTYRFDGQGVTVRHALSARARPWSQVRRIDLGRDVALLSPFPKARRLDRFRGLWVPLEGAPREAIALLEARARELVRGGPDRK